MSDEANRMQAIKNIAAKGPGEATSQDYAILETLTSGKKHNPAFVLESQFAKNWIADNTYIDLILLRCLETLQHRP